jgi:hypothetical protein
VIDDPTLPFATNAPNIARYLIAATTAHFPAFNFTGLTPLARDRWLNVEAAVQGCLPTDGLIFADVPGDQVYLEGWQEDHAIQEYVKLGRPGGRKVKGPMLIISGEGDLVALIEYSKAAVERTCKVMDKKESLEYVTYERANHFGVIQASQHRWLGWIQDRFADKKYGKSGCKTNEKVEDFRGESTFGSIPPNFLATWVSPQEGWKYTL